MPTLNATDSFALSLLLTEEIYLIKEEEIHAVNTERITAKEAVYERKQIKFNYLGENNKYLLLLVNEPKYEVIGPNDLDSLNGILKAKNMELRDVALVNLAKYPDAKYEEMKAFFVPSKLVLFGVNPQSIGLPAFTANVIAEHSGAKILATFGFAEMQNDVNRKRLFWNEMKKL